MLKLELERILRKYLNNRAQRVVFDPVPSSITNIDEINKNMLITKHIFSLYIYVQNYL